MVDDEGQEAFDRRVLEPVAQLVQQAGGSAEQIAAAYLHDAAEDGGGEPMLKRISDETSPAVAAIVGDLSDSLVDTSSGADPDGPHRPERGGPRLGRLLTAS